MKKIIIIDAAVFVALGLLSFFLISALTDQSARFGGLAYGMILPMCVTAPITCWFLLTSLKEFKTSSRHAYYIICAGIFLFALAQIEQVAMALMVVFLPGLAASLGDTLVSLLFFLPFASSLLALYLGVRKLARILNVRTIWRSVIFTLVFSTLSAGLYLILPLSDPNLAVLAQIILFCGSLTLAATLVTNRIASTISSAYRAAMYWMVAGLAVLAAGIIQEIIFKGTALIDSAYIHYAMDLAPFLLAAFLFMEAGRAFKAATFRRLPTSATYIDAVVYTAELVSNKTAIDPILDNLRKITAQMQDTNSLSPAEKKTLLGVYLQLEAYLVEQEPMRNFTAASIRERLPGEFHEAVAQA